MLVLAWLVSAVVLGVAFLSCAGACVVVVQGAALCRPPFAALAGWLCCLAGLAARSCSRCLTGENLCGLLMSVGRSLPDNVVGFAAGLVVRRDLVRDWLAA